MVPLWSQSGVLYRIVTGQTYTFQLSHGIIRKWLIFWQPSRKHLGRILRTLTPLHWHRANAGPASHTPVQHWSGVKVPQPAESHSWPWIKDKLDKSLLLIAIRTGTWVARDPYNVSVGIWGLGSSLRRVRVIILTGTLLLNDTRRWEMGYGFKILRTRIMQGVIFWLWMSSINRRRPILYGVILMEHQFVMQGWLFCMKADLCINPSPTRPI